jgi:hypothetical protein
MCCIQYEYACYQAAGAQKAESEPGEETASEETDDTVENGLGGR